MFSVCNGRSAVERLSDAGKGSGAWRFPIARSKTGLCSCLIATDLFAYGAAVKLQQILGIHGSIHAFHCVE